MRGQTIIERSKNLKAREAKQIECWELILELVFSIDFRPFVLNKTGGEISRGFYLQDYSSVTAYKLLRCTSNPLLQSLSKYLENRESQKFLHFFP